MCVVGGLRRKRDEPHPGTSRKEAVTSERAVPSSASVLPGLMMGDDADAMTLADRLGRSLDRDVLDVAVDH